jgi:hypothetical protein
MAKVNQKRRGGGMSRRLSLSAVANRRRGSGLRPTSSIAEEPQRLNQLQPQVGRGAPRRRARIAASLRLSKVFIYFIGSYDCILHNI